MEEKVIILIIVGTIGVMLMAFSVVFFVLLYRRKVLENRLQIQEIKNKHQQEMLNATLKSQEDERNRLGTELHDSVGAMLSSIKLNLQVTKKKEGVDSLDSVMGHLDQTIGQVRNISHQMMPIILKKYGLKRAIEDLFEKIPAQKLTANISQWEEPGLCNEKSVMLFRIVQELTNNTLKHAKASFIDCSLTRLDNKLSFTFCDNGEGFAENILLQNEGMGLLNIKTRALALGADVQFSNATDGGVLVNLVIDTSID